MIAPNLRTIAALTLALAATTMVTATVTPAVGSRPLAASTVVAKASPLSPLQSPVAEGAKLFVAYNCADCHGAGGSGAMGPAFVDNRWRFGGSSAEVFRSIAEGRPEGMPAWGPMIPRDHIEKLVAYVQSLGAGKDLSTENFTGATVERTGH